MHLPVFLLSSIIAVFLLAPMASSGEFCPVSEIPISGGTVVSPVSASMTITGYIFPDEAGDDGFVKILANILHSYPCPLVICCDEKIELRDVLDIPEDREDIFRKYMRTEWRLQKMKNDISTRGSHTTTAEVEKIEQTKNEMEALEKQWKTEEQALTSQSSTMGESVRTEEECQRTWKDALDLIERESANYHVTPHKNFIEMAWGSQESIETMKGNLSKEVPPISFLATSPEQFLPMWQAVSGLSIEYDPVFLMKTKPFQNQAKDLSEIDMDGQEDETYESDEILTVTQTIPVEDFMDILAERVSCGARYEKGRWRIGDFPKVNRLSKLVRDLLNEIETSPFQSDPNSARDELKKLGLPALPFVLKEFEVAKGNYYDAIVDVLSSMDCPERDAAFLSKVHLGAESGEQFVENNWYAFQMIQTLARRGVRDVIPIIRKCAIHNWRTACEAKICLNNLDAPLPPTDPASLLIIGSTKEEGFKNPDLAEAKDILYAVLDQSRDNDEPLLLCEIKQEENGLVSFGGPLNEPGATWEVRIRWLTKEKVSVTKTFNGIPMGGGEHEGIVVKRNGRWLIIEWRQIWIG